VSAYVVTLAPIVAIVEKLTPSVDRWIVNPPAPVEAYAQERSISLLDAAAACRLVGAASGVDAEVCARGPFYLVALSTARTR
jgi:hypothetical protein